MCLYKFPKPPNFIGVFFVFSVGNLFDIEHIGTSFLKCAKVGKNLECPMVIAKKGDRLINQLIICATPAFFGAAKDAFVDKVLDVAQGGKDTVVAKPLTDYFHSNVSIKWSMSCRMKLMTGCIESLLGGKLK